MATTSSAPAVLQKFERIMPELPLADVAAGVIYYRDALGFSVNYEMTGFAVMDRDRARILLITKTERYRGIASCYVYVADADGLYAEFVARGANAEAAPINRPWGLREFRVFDPEGNILTFGQPFE
jgi:catechol 2,3-dioxygenase-like lactoylglutathione lyase family enzyme